jgi:hypothetical protein
MEISPEDLLKAAQTSALLLAIIVAAGLAIVGGLWLDEKIMWNGGVSRRTGKRWKFIKRDKLSGHWVWWDGTNYQAFMFKKH